MRITLVSAAAALVLVSFSTALHGQRADDQIDARSTALLAAGKEAKAAGNLEAATDALESALAADPRNREAYVELGNIAQARELPGKAIRMYREALKLEPNDLQALKGQGEALVARGAVDRAKANLSQIQKLCATSCAEATQLAAAIARGPQANLATASASATPPVTRIPDAPPPEEKN